MKESLRPGCRGSAVLRSIATARSDSWARKAAFTPRPIWCATSNMTCRDLILEHADASEDSVGTDIAIKHLAPTLLGMTVEITATVSAVEGRKVAFEISAKDELEQICSGTHGRFVVDVDKTIERLKAKAAKLLAPIRMIKMPGKPAHNERTVSTYCYQCVAGPDLLKVRVEDGIATEVTPNFDAATIHPAGGKVCVKAFGLVQKAYNPNRILYPMKRTNPNKGRDEDPGFVRISWEEALSLVADKLNAVRAAGLTDETGYPRVAASFGGGGTPTAYMGTLPAFLAAWGPVDMSFGSGQGVKCYHSEHLYGELWHRGFTVSPDTPLCEYLVSFGANVEASGGVCGVKRHADARKRGMKRVQIEPHLSVTGACSAEWIPIKPKTNSAFLFAMIHVFLHEHPRDRLDLPFLKHRTSSPYLVGPNGLFMRDASTRKPLVMDGPTGRAVPFDTAGIDPTLEGSFVVDGVEVGS